MKLTLRKIEELSHRLSSDNMSYSDKEKGIERIGDFVRYYEINKDWRNYCYIFKLTTEPIHKEIDMILRGCYGWKKHALMLPSLEIEKMDVPKTIKQAKKLLKGNFYEQIAGLAVIKSLHKLGYKKETAQILRNEQGLDFFDVYKIAEDKREKEFKIKQKKLQNEEDKKKQAENLENWGEGKIDTNLLNKVFTEDSYAFLRVRGKDIETSKQAKIPVSEVKRLHPIWLKGVDKIIGKQIGGFSIVKANGEWKIGCHQIKNEEVMSLLKKLKLKTYAKLTHKS